MLAILTTSISLFLLNISKITLGLLNNENCHLTSTLETDDCFISFIECNGNKFVVKQIKDPSPDEQFLLVLDTLGCFIAESSDIPMNKVTIIPPNMPFHGKKILEFPATLHSLAIGISTDQKCFYQDIDVHQRFRKENSPMWQRWGPLPSEKTGLTIGIIQNMAKHPDLPRIVALDTFLGNADRSSPNLYYDKTTDSFCGIDMAASFSSPLALVAYQHLQKVDRSHLTSDEFSALMEYANTLEFLINNWHPEKQERILLEYSEEAGFKNGGRLFDQNVAERIEFHKMNIKNNYQNSIDLLKLINQQLRASQT
jgi:hypothetical protein